MNLRGRAPRAVLAGLLVAACAAVELNRTGAVLETAEAALAGLLAAGVAALALTLPGLTWRGGLLGGVFVTAGILSWTYTTRPIVIWVFLGAGGVLFAIWSYPWLRDVPWLARLGGFWLGVAYWHLGIIGALIAVRLEVAAERVAYAGVFTLAVLAVVASVRRGRDLTVGVAAAFLLAIAVLLVAGSGNVFDTVNPVPEGGWGVNMERRFWGGAALRYHPNSLGLIAIVAAVRIGPDRAFAPWQRASAVGLAGLIVYLTESRTAFGVAVLAGLLHGYAVWRGRVSYPDRRAALAAVALPFVALALVLAASGGQGFLYKARYGGGDITSGRTATWAKVFDEWRAAGIGDKLFGDTRTTRAVVVRDGNQLTTDNSPIGALRRGGVLGVLAFVVGLVLLLARVLPGLRGGGRADPRAPPWLAILLLATLPAMAVADWFLGGTGGTLWIMLLVAEVAIAVPASARTPVAAP